MAAQKSVAAPAEQAKVSGERAGRLYRLLKILSGGSTPRTQILKKIKVGMRTFYRDLDLLRACGIDIQTVPGGYGLGQSLDDALYQLPFPDPELTFGDVATLMKGRSSSHAKLQRLFERLTR